MERGTIDDRRWTIDLTQWNGDDGEGKRSNHQNTKARRREKYVRAGCILPLRGASTARRPSKWGYYPQSPLERGTGERGRCALRIPLEASGSRESDTCTPGTARQGKCGPNAVRCKCVAYGRSNRLSCKRNFNHQSQRHKRTRKIEGKENQVGNGKMLDSVPPAINDDLGLRRPCPFCQGKGAREHTAKPSRAMVAYGPSSNRPSC